MKKTKDVLEKLKSNDEEIFINEVVLDKIMKEFIISKQDFKNYFNGRCIINKNEYQEYLELKNKQI